MSIVCWALLGRGGGARGRVFGAATGGLGSMEDVLWDGPAMEQDGDGDERVPAGTRPREERERGAMAVGTRTRRVDHTGISPRVGVGDLRSGPGAGKGKMTRTQLLV